MAYKSVMTESQLVVAIEKLCPVPSGQAAVLIQWYTPHKYTPHISDFVVRETHVSNTLIDTTI